MKRLLIIALLMSGCRLDVPKPPKPLTPTKDNVGCPLLNAIPARELYQPFAQLECDRACSDGATSVRVDWSCMYYRCFCIY